ncbi:MAG: TetR family transcriptional regulator C-terminal domain-containing protein [Rhodococcus sp. (in: high G+C Gram-positive bacteria)]
MTSPATDTGRRRKRPDTRKSEISGAAAHIAVADGLAKVTAKRVADAVGVYPGLVTHYFRTADELVAAAFSAAIEVHRPGPEGAPAARPLDRLRTFLQVVLSPEHDPIALLWLDAWRESRHRPILQAEVIRQMETDLRELSGLLEAGASAGDFTVADCASTAMRIMAMIDGMFGQSAVRSALAGASTLDYPTVEAMLLRTTEQELGLADGTLDTGE